MSTGKFQLMLLTLYMLGKFNIAVDVVWKAKLPVFFGKVTYLQCKISGTDNCTIIPRQWIGGTTYGSLCYNDECSIANKYEVMKPSGCLYTLMIRDFSEVDVNREYTCLYGVTKMRRNFTLNEKSFIYEPHVAEIMEESIKKDKTLDLRVNISKIFPKPTCRADLNGENITDLLQSSITKPGFYYTADIQIKFPLSPCGKINVKCYLGDHTINIISKNFDGCQFKGAIIMLVSTMLTIMIAVSVLVLCMYRKEKLCFNNNRKKFMPVKCHYRVKYTVTVNNM